MTSSRIRICNTCTSRPEIWSTFNPTMEWVARLPSLSNSSWVSANRWGPPWCQTPLKQTISRTWYVCPNSSLSSPWSAHLMRRDALLKSARSPTTSRARSRQWFHASRTMDVGYRTPEDFSIEAYRRVSRVTHRSTTQAAHRRRWWGGELTLVSLSCRILTRIMW